jgi:hypothetical protein
MFPMMPSPMAKFFENGFPIRNSLIPFSPEFFSDENDHNPLVARECEHCFGTGRCSRGEWNDDGTEHILYGWTCGDCDGKGFFGDEPVRFFMKGSSGGKAVDNSPFNVVPRKYGNKYGTIKCPNCGRWFLPDDRQRFTGKRCGSCGQKITIGKAAATKPEVVVAADEMKKLPTAEILAALRKKP